MRHSKGRFIEDLQNVIRMRVRVGFVNDMYTQCPKKSSTGAEHGRRGGMPRYCRWYRNVMPSAREVISGATLKRERVDNSGFSSPGLGRCEAAMPNL